MKTSSAFLFISFAASSRPSRYSRRRGPSGLLPCRSCNSAYATRRGMHCACPACPETGPSDGGNEIQRPDLFQYRFSLAGKLAPIFAAFVYYYRGAASGLQEFPPVWITAAHANQQCVCCSQGSFAGSQSRSNRTGGLHQFPRNPLSRKGRMWRRAGLGGFMISESRVIILLIAGCQRGRVRHWQRGSAASSSAGGIPRSCQGDSSGSRDVRAYFLVRHKVHQGNVFNILCCGVDIPRNMASDICLALCGDLKLVTDCLSTMNSCFFFIVAVYHQYSTPIGASAKFVDNVPCINPCLLAMSRLPPDHEIFVVLLSISAICSVCKDEVSMPVQVLSVPLLYYHDRPNAFVYSHVPRIALVLGTLNVLQHQDAA
eukprot:284817542_4